MSDTTSNGADSGDRSIDLQEENTEPQQEDKSNARDSTDVDDQNEITFGPQTEDSIDDAGSRVDTPRGHLGKDMVRSGIGVLSKIIDKGKIAHRKHLKNKKLRDKQPCAVVSTNVKFPLHTCPVVVDVFNTAELL